MKFSFYPIAAQARDEAAEKLGSNPEYIKVLKEKKRIFEEIKTLLPADKKDLIFNYEELEAESDNLLGDELYIMGIQNGVELAGLLR